MGAPAAAASVVATVQEHGAALRAFSLRLCPSEAEAAALVRDCLRRADARLDSLAPGANPLAWLFAILHDAFVGRCRREQAAKGARSQGDVDVPPPVPTPAPRWVDVTPAELVRAVTELEDELRVVYEQCAQSRTYREVSDRLGLPVSTVAARVSRARAEIRAVLEKGLPEERVLVSGDGCKGLVPFLQGELDSTEAEAFRDHLADCDGCARRLHDEMMHAAVADAYRSAKAGFAQQRPRGPGSVPRSGGRRRGRVVAAALVVSGLAVAFTALALRHRAEQRAGVEHTVLESAPARSLEVRLAYVPADRYRPLDVSRAPGLPPHEVVSAATLAALETRGDLHGVAAGLLLAGEIDRADGYLSRSPPSVAVDADRAAVLIERGKVLEALAALDGVLARAPALPQALFNRALVLRQMGLRLAAAEAFDKVAALEEEGWRDEARKVADAQRSREQWRQAAWNGAVAAGHAMAVEGRLPDAMVVDASPDCIRHFFYHAVRMAPTPERVGSLAPIACRLDARAGGHTLSDLVVRAAANRNPARGAWAATYGRLLDRSDALSDEDKERYIAALRAAGEDDMLFGALVLSDRASAHADELERIATAAHDPWLSTVALWHRADAQLSRGDRQGAVSTLRQAITRYAGEPVAWPLAKLASMLTWLLVNDGRTAEGRSVALQGLRLGRRSAPEMMNNFLFRLADIGRIEGDASSAAAFGREAELVDPNDCAVVSATHTVLAEVRARALDVQGLDAELVGAAKCHPPMTPQLADLIVSSVRMGGHPPGEGSVLADLAAARSHLPPASRMFADVVEARRLYVDDPAAGEARAARVLLEAHPAAVHDVGALQAEVYARLTLAIGAATAGNGDEALAQIAAGALRSDASSAVSGCALGLAVDGDRELAVTRGASGPVSLHLTTRASAALTPDATVAREAAARFAGCPTVRVYALPPVRGMAGALPADIAWAYVSAPAVLSPAGAAPRRVVVSEPVPPADLALPGLDGWGPPPEGVAWLHGPEATPSAVLGAFSTATEISVQAHGMVDSTESATAFIALSPEGGGRYALTADDLRADSFRAHPVVVLAACHAARSAGHEVDSWSLPAAFVRAGARAVLASPREIRAAQAGPFFDGVMSRIRAGAAPSVALRDERASWLARDPNSPVGDVVDFE